MVLRNQESDNSGAFRRTLQFFPLVSSEDSGLYTCMVNVSSNYPSNFIVNASISRTNEYIIVGKLIFCVCVHVLKLSKFIVVINFKQNTLWKFLVKA